MTYFYPLTVCLDRYSGCYSGGKWLAFNLQPDAVPNAIHEGGDCEAAEFWEENKIPYGKGDSIKKAIKDLKNNLRKKKE